MKDKLLNCTDRACPVSTVFFFILHYLSSLYQLSMKSSFFYIFLLVFMLPTLSAQNLHISGVVSDKDNNEQIINAYIIEQNSKVTALSNNYGFFSLSLPKSDCPYVLVVSNVAYNTDTLTLSPKNDTSLQIQLQAGKYLTEVEVLGNRPEPIAQRNEISTVSVPMKQIEILPSFGGERDIIKAYQMMPGVQSGNEGSSGLLVRGGSPDQNLMLIDGIPVYYVNHLAGFVSVFNNDALKSTKLYKGGFPARYGGRVSSVLDVHMKDGDNTKFGGSASLGLLSAKVMVEGPIKKNQSSYLVSFRRMLYDLLTRPAIKLATQTTSGGYTFYDFNLKLNHKFSNKDRLYLSLYSGDDRMNIKYKEKFNGGSEKSKYSRRWGNLVSSLRWNHIFNNKLFSNVSAAFTRYRFASDITYKAKEDHSTQEHLNSFFSGIYDYSIQPDFEYYPTSFYKIRFGALATQHVFKPAFTKQQSKLDGQDIINTSSNNKPIYATEAAAYIENDIRLSHFLFNLGVRYAYYAPSKDQFHYLEPRLLAKYLLSEQHSVQVSYTKMHQNMHLLSNSSLGLPVDFWLPAVGKAAPPASHQFAIGYSGTLSPAFDLEVEGFYKSMDNLSTFKEGVSYFGTNQAWIDKMETGGKGTVYGIDVLLRKTTGKVTGWLGYTWMKNYRQFDNINGGKRYPYKYDRTHDINLVLNYKFADNVDFSVTWVYGTGQALTLPIAKYSLPVNVDNIDPNMPEPV